MSEVGAPTHQDTPTYAPADRAMECASRTRSSDVMTGSADLNPSPRRVVALRQDHNNVWLMSDQGRLLAANQAEFKIIIPNGRWRL